MSVYVSLYRLLELLDGEVKWKVLPYRFASKMKWQCLKRI